MPGIFGAFSYNGQPVNKTLVSEFCNLLAHEPWYGSHICDSKGFRAGILSSYPYFSKDYNIHETADHLLLIDGMGIAVDGRAASSDKSSLAATLLDMYTRLGDEFVRRVEGSYNIVIFDKRDSVLRLFNDRFGFSHMYYYSDDKTFMFAPEVKAFLAYPELDKTLNPRAISFYLSSDCVFGNETFFEKVMLMPSASKVKVSKDGVEISTYWRPEMKPDYDMSKEDIVDRALDMYRASLRKKLPADPDAPIIFPLSGGLDSRLQLRLATETHSNLMPFTHGHEQCNDLRIARQIVGKFGLEKRHRFVPLRPEWLGTNAYEAVWLNDGHIDPLNVRFMGVARELGPGPITFVFGIFGAAMSLGTGSHFNLDQIRPIDDEQYLKDNMLKSGYFPFRPDLLKEFLKDDTAAEFERICRDYAWDCFQEYRVHERFCDQKMMFINFNWHRRKMAVHDAFQYYFDRVLPLLDYDLFDLCLTIPPELKIGNVLYKELYKRHFPDLAAIPWAKTGKNLYASQSAIRRVELMRQARHNLAYGVRRLSRGNINLKDNVAFYDYETWLRKCGPVRDVILPAVKSAADASHGLFDGDKITHLLNEFDIGKHWRFAPLIRVFNFSVWYRLFVENEYKTAIPRFS